MLFEGDNGRFFINRNRLTGPSSPSSPSSPNAGGDKEENSKGMFDLYPVESESRAIVA